MRTIPRGSKKMLQIKAEFTEILGYDPSSAQMVPADAEQAWKDLAIYDRARLVESSDATRYTIRVHGSKFYHLTRPTT
jgi:hypothetical protein